MCPLPECTKNSGQVLEKEAAAFNVSDWELAPNWLYLFYFEVDNKFSKIPTESPGWPLDFKNSEKVSLMCGAQIDMLLSSWRKNIMRTQISRRI